MENNRNSGSYSARVASTPSQPLPDSYTSKRPSSYRRPIDTQPTPTQNQLQAPTTSNTIASNSARPVAAAPAANGVSRSASHRRRQSQQIPPLASGTMSPPPAPDVPRGPPPTSYRDPYAPKGGSRSSRQYSGRRDPPIQQNASRQQAHIQIAPDRLRSPPYAPPESLSGTLEGLGRNDPQTRRPSVPDRSPLQKLEGKLDDISKEEKRARMLELELAAQEKAEADMRARRAREAAAKQQRIVSGPVKGPQRSDGAPSRTTSTRRHVSMPVQQKPKSPVISELDDSDDGFMYDISEPWDPSGGASRQPTSHALKTSGSQRQKTDGLGRIPSVKGKEPVGVNRGTGSFRDRTGGTQAGEGTEPKAQRVDRKPVPVPTGLGLHGVDELPHASRPTGANISRYDSKLLSKDLPLAPQGYGQPGDRRRDSRGIMAAQMEMEQQRIDNKANSRNLDRPLSFQSSSQATTTRRGVDFAPELDEPSNDVSRDPGHDVFSHREPDRRYIAPPMLDDWKAAPVASLGAEDLDLEAPVKAENTNKAWWEESQSSRRRRSGTYTQPTYDGYADEPTTQTSFNPPLYLKCGPLLRYTGLRRDKTRPGKEREIWRGSVMIVTEDKDSYYHQAPVLRLFKQPMDLLPPPPAQIDAEGQPLNPAYVDPVEGQTKVSRSGKTLYVKPVDELLENLDLSTVETDHGLFQQTPVVTQGNGATSRKSSRILKCDGEKLGRFREIPGIRLHAERNVTFWRFNLEVELGPSQARIAYKINRGPAIGFWVPAKGETMNMMFHSCNGFSYSVDSKEFCGPDPMWRDVLNNHQTRPFHVMIGGGDQIYNDAAMHQTTLFRQWTESRNPLQKRSASFSSELQNELEQFYLDRYSMWFSQGLFGMANSQIPMINMWDDHDIIDGFGSYPHHFMSTPVFTGLGAVAFKYYMLFQHQSVVGETQKTEPSWALGAKPGPYIKEQSRSLFMFLGRQVAFLGLDCRTERQRDEVLTEESYNLILDRLEDEIVKGETKHLLVLLGVPIAYPRLNFLENILTSRLMDPIKALGRTGLLGNFVNKFDGGVEILDDLDDHWTAKHHKDERNWFITQLQQLAAMKSVRITILSGDVHLAAVGQFYSNKKLNIPKDKDHRYMPNVISSAIVNTPPPEMMADILNKRNKIHHLDPNTDEDMISLFLNDSDGKPRNNNHLLPRRNWCSLREYKPGATPPGTPSENLSPNASGLKLTRTLSDYTPGKMVRRMSGGPRGRERGPPVAYYNNPAYAAADEDRAGVQSSFSPEREERPRSRRNSLTSLFRRRASVDSVHPPGSAQSLPAPHKRNSFAPEEGPEERPSPFHRRSSILIKKKHQYAGDYINLEGGLSITLNLEVSQHDPAGITAPYTLLVPALSYMEPEAGIVEKERRKSRIGSMFGMFGGGNSKRRTTVGDDGYSQDSRSISSQSDDLGEVDEDERARQRYKVGPRILLPSFSKKRNSTSNETPYTNPTAPPPDRRASTQLPRQPDPTPPFHSGPRDPAQARDLSDRRASAPISSGHFTRPVPPPQTTSYNTTQTQTSTLPNRSNSTRASRGPSYNSSHKSQLPEPEPKVHRRSMGGILNQHRGERFEHDAHVLAHAPSGRKRESYPPHPAIVGAGPGSPYSRGGVEARDDTGAGSGGGGYFGSGGARGAGTMGGGGAGVGAAYLGNGRYANEGGYSDDGEEGYSEDERSQSSFEAPKQKSRWKIWK
ncbi:hypothetical protein B0J11DRAFT_568815 [Dendryphion nanum]|uniref:PhoD-like phosphatase domain-containing protein n=1 Tax=Dendryphion nanum TaxID=256645 RepID=A0A9P9DRC1_9PLEO|nr:hypothetical protein B0J11DRAFT_568815 [Dendryphion nanum]